MQPPYLFPICLLSLLFLAGPAIANCEVSPYSCDTQERCSNCPEDCGQCLSFILEAAADRDLVTPNAAENDLLVTVTVNNMDPHPEPAISDNIDAITIRLKNGVTNEEILGIPVSGGGFSGTTPFELSKTGPNTLTTCAPLPCTFTKTFTFPDLSTLEAGGYTVEASILTSAVPPTYPAIEIDTLPAPFTVGKLQSTAVPESNPLPLLLLLLTILVLLRRS